MKVQFIVGKRSIKSKTINLQQILMRWEKGDLWLSTNLYWSQILQSENVTVDNIRAWETNCILLPAGMFGYWWYSRVKAIIELCFHSRFLFVSFEFPVFHLSWVHLNYKRCSHKSHFVSAKMCVNHGIIFFFVWKFCQVSYGECLLFSHKGNLCLCLTFFGAISLMFVYASFHEVIWEVGYDREYLKYSVQLGFN